MEVDLSWLLKARLAIARCGEMDCAGWWNTQGQLGPRGAVVLARGFPRTHYFAQARSVLAAAAARCLEVFSHPTATTLWWLGEEVEEAVDLQWENWLAEASSWNSFFEQLSDLRSADPLAMLTQLKLASAAEGEMVEKFRVDPSGRSAEVVDSGAGTAATARLLALGFAQGSEGKLVVPYAMGAP